MRSVFLGCNYDNEVLFGSPVILVNIPLMLFAGARQAGSHDR